MPANTVCVCDCWSWLLFVFARSQSSNECAELRAVGRGRWPKLSSAMTLPLLRCRRGAPASGCQTSRTPSTARPSLATDAPRTTTPHCLIALRPPLRALTVPFCARFCSARRVLALAFARHPLRAGWRLFRKAPSWRPQAHSHSQSRFAASREIATALYEVLVCTALAP